MKIVLTGGGTGGAVMPLIAIAQELKKDPRNELYFFGTRKKYPEIVWVEKEHIPFYGIYSGKLRRYFSARTFLVPFGIVAGILQALFYLRRIRPDVVIGTGGFVSIPVGIAAWLLRIPFIIHQQDITPGITNRFLSFFATKITVALAETKKYFPKRKCEIIGNPYRARLLYAKKEDIRKILNVPSGMPIVLIMGGSLGAVSVNSLVEETLEKLVKKFFVIHIVGKNYTPKFKHRFYWSVEMMDENIFVMMQAADCIVSRAGFNTITECALLGKAMILLPIQDSLQEDNARYFARQKAVEVIYADELTEETLYKKIVGCIENKQRLALLGSNLSKLFPRDANEKFIRIIHSVVK